MTLYEKLGRVRRYLYECLFGGGKRSARPRNARLALEALNGFVCERLFGSDRRSAEPPHARLALEQLGDRVVPATVYWSGAGNDNLASNPANYAGGVPVTGDTLVFDGVARGGPAGAANKNVNFDAGFSAQQLAEVKFLDGYTGGATVTANTTITGSFVSERAKVTVNANTTLTIRDSTIPGDTFLGAGTLSVGLSGQPGRLDLVGESGLQIGNVKINAGSTLVVPGDMAFDTQLTNDGLIDWQGGTLTLGGANNALVNNGTVSTASDSILNGAATFRNDGLFVKDCGEGTLSIWLKYEQGSTGSMQVTMGGVSFDVGEAKLASPVFVGEGARVAFTKGVHTFEPGSGFDGDGTLSVTGDATAWIPVGAALAVSTDLVFSNDEDTGVVVGGGGTLTALSSFEWGGGWLKDLASVNTYGETHVHGTKKHTLSNTTLNQYGEATWTGTGNIDLDEAVWANYGTFDIKNNARIGRIVPGDEVSAFENRVDGAYHGEVTKQDVPAPLNSPGTLFDVKFTTAGDVTLIGARVTFEQGFTQAGLWSETYLSNADLFLGNGLTLTLTGGLLKGHGTIGGSLSNVGGVVWVGSATGNTLNVSGSYLQDCNANLRFHASSDTDWGTMNVSGSATLAGTVSVAAVGGYVPSANLAVRVLTVCDSITDYATAAQGGYTAVFGDYYLDLVAPNLGGGGAPPP